MDFSKKYETEAGEDTVLANLTRLLAKKFVSQLSTKERKGFALGREVAQGVLSAKEAKVKAVANSTSGGGDDNDDFASCEAIDGPASTSKKASDLAQKKVSGKKRDRGEDTSQEKTSTKKEEEGKATSATAGRNVADLKKLRPENEKEKKTKNKSPASSSLAAPALVGEKEMLAALASLRSSASQKAKGSKKSVEGKLEKSDAKAVVSSGTQKQPTPQHLADESDQDLDAGDSLEDEEDYFDEEGEEFEDEEDYFGEEGEEFEDEEEFDAADEELEEEGEEEEELEEEDDNACSLKKVAPAPTFGSSTPLSGNGTTAAAATSKENKRVKTEAELIADEEAELSKYNFDDAFEGDAEQAMLDAISIPSTDEDEEEIGEEEEGDEGEEDEESDDDEDYTAQRGKGKTGSALPANTKGTKQGLRPEQASAGSERGGNKKGTALPPPPPPPPVPQVKVKAVNPMTLSRQQAAKLKQQQQRMQQQQQHQQQGNNKGGGGGNKKKGGGGGGLYSGGNQAGWSDDD